jgi:hypothetical protein
LPGTDSVQTVLKTERPSSSERRYQTCEFPAVESTGILEPLKFLALTELYEALLTNAGSGVPTGIRTPVLTVKGWCPRPLDDGDNRRKQSTLQSGGARRDRTADLLHAMQALSQLSYGPTWRRGTLPERAQFVKKLNDLRAPEGLHARQPGKRLDFAQYGQRGVDGGGHSTAAYRQPNRLRELA